MVVRWFARTIQWRGGDNSPGGGGRWRPMSQDGLRCQMALLAQDARQRSHGGTAHHPTYLITDP